MIFIIYSVLSIYPWSSGNLSNNAEHILIRLRISNHLFMSLTSIARFVSSCFNTRIIAMADTKHSFHYSRVKDHVFVRASF